MKKLLAIIILSCTLGSVNLFAQSPIDKGQIQMNFGTGFNNFGVAGATPSIPVYLGLDFGIAETLSLGPILSYQGYKTPVQGTNATYNQSIIGIGFNVDYHFNKLLNIPDEFDVYGGGSAGYFIWSSNDVVVAGTTYSSNSTNDFEATAHVGGRFNFHQRWALHVQVNAGTHTGAMAGLTMKF